jgi:hypothetical protein
MATAVGALYLQVIGSQGDLDEVVVWYVAALIFGAAVACVVAAFFTSGTVRVYTGTAVSVLLAFVGLLGIFTIGMPLLIAGAFAVAGTARAARHADARAVVAAGVGIGTLITTGMLFAVAFTASR